MKQYIIRRLMVFIPTLLVVSFLLFLLLDLAPGSTSSYLLGPEASPEEILRLNEAMGLNKPVIVRYFSWIGELFKGNLGYSLMDNSPVTDILAAKIPITLKLMGMSLVFAIIIGVGLGMVSALQQKSFLDNSLTFVGLTGISLPHFFTGLILLLIFSIKLDVFPIGGIASEGGLINELKHLALPVIALSFRTGAEFIRYTRGSLLDVLNREYIALAKSKGLKKSRVNIVHAFRTALIPVSTVILLRLPALIGGSIIIENIFSWPGIGSMFIEAVKAKDFPVVMSVSMIIACLMLVVSLLSDIVLAWLDPRVRYE